MPDLSPRQHWDGIYSSRADNELSWFEASPYRSLALISRTGVRHSAAIVDVGGGLSRLADHLVEDGYSDVTVLDISAEAIGRLLARQHAGAPVQGIVSDISHWQPARSYAVWHDRAVLHFLTDEPRRAAYRNAFLAALAPNGQAIIATFAPSGPSTCSGLPVRRYGAQELSEWLQPELRMLESFECDHTTPSGNVQRFHVARLGRR